MLEGQNLKAFGKLTLAFASLLARDQTMQIRLRPQLTSAG
mgnify:CR=1 FL=1